MNFQMDDVGHQLLKRAYTISPTDDEHIDWLDDLERYLGARHTMIGTMDLSSGHVWNAGSKSALSMVVGPGGVPNVEWLAHLEKYKWLYDLTAPRAKERGPEKLFTPKELHLETREWETLDEWTGEIERLRGYSLMLGGAFGTESRRLGFLGMGFDDKDRADEVQANQAFWLTHLTGASALYQRLARTEGQLEITQRALNVLKWGIFVLDERAQVIATNTEATAILEGPSGIYLKSGHFHAAPGVLTALAKLSLSEPRPQDRQSFLGTSGSEGARDRYVIFGSAFNDNSGTFDRPGTGRMVFVLDTIRFPPMGIALAQQVFGLTEAEGLVAGHMIDGLIRSEIAETRGVSLETVKSQIKAVYEKSICRNPAQLASKVAMLDSPLRDETC